MSAKPECTTWFKKEHIVKLLMLLLLVTVAFGGEDNPLPRATKSKIDAFNQRVERLRAEFVEEYQRELAKVVKDLEKDQTAITKKGDLEGALAVKKVIEELQSRKPVTDILGNAIQPVETFEIGKYTMTAKGDSNKYEWEFFPKGTVVSGGKSTGTYTVKDDVLTVKFGNAYRLARNDSGWAGTIVDGKYKGREVLLVPKRE
jgi:hypothetical protein